MKILFYFVDALILVAEYFLLNKDFYNFLKTQYLFFEFCSTFIEHETLWESGKKAVNHPEYYT